MKNDAPKALVETNPAASTRELATRMEIGRKILRHLSEIGKVKRISGYHEN